MPMNDGKSTLVEKLSAIKWGLGIAWKIDKKMLLLWGGLTMALSVLPAIALIYNKQALSILSGFLSGEPYAYSDVVSTIIVLLTLIGLSARVNRDLIYMMMFDSYCFGMEELLTDAIHRIKLEDLLKKDVNDEYNYVVWRVGSITDLTSSLCDIVGKIVSLASLLIVASTSSKLVFVISLFYIVGVFILNYIMTDKIRFNSVLSRNETSMANYYENLSQNVGAAKETRIFGNVERIIKQWESHFMVIQESNRKRYLARTLNSFISGVGFYVFLILMISLSLLGVVKGNMSPDVFLIIFTLSLNIFTVVSVLPSSIEALDFGIYALERQMHFFNFAPIRAPEDEANKKDTVEDEDTVYKVDNLIFKYGNDNAAINGVSFEIKKGDVVALVGQNGSGKTTLIKLLANMFTPESGNIAFYGRPMADYKGNFVNSKIGVFFQDFWLFHLTLRENIGFGNVGEIDNTDKILAAVNKGGAGKLLSRLPKGLDTLVNKTVDKTGTIFSGGERQRIGASRTHMNDKEVLIFDEPASMLDPIAEMEQFMNIREMLNGRTAILISHRVGFARLASKILMMDGGRIAECGTHEELMALDGLYANMFNQQAKWYDTESQEVLA